VSVRKRPLRKEEEAPAVKPGEDAMHVARLLVKDVQNRLGLGQEWERIDFDVRQEIQRAWALIVENALRKQEARLREEFRQKDLERRDTRAFELEEGPNLE
jgi:tRNA 2-selenouridine synthase SelU